MSRPYSITLHIAEKNRTKDELDELISILQEKKSFSLLGSSFSSNNTHNGTTLVKTVSGKNVETVFEGVKKDLENTEINMTGRFNCQLTAAATDVKSDVLFMK